MTELVAIRCLPETNSQSPESLQNASLFKVASDKTTSHDMADFFLAPYKAQIEAMQEEEERKKKKDRKNVPDVAPVAKPLVRVEVVRQLLTAQNAVCTFA